MSKKVKVLIIIASIVVTLGIVIGSFNIAFSVIGKQEQKGNATGYAWSNEDAFDIAKIQSLDMGEDDFKVLCLTDVHLKNHGTFAAFLGINYILDWAGEIALSKLIKESGADLIVITGDTVLTDRNDIEYERFVKFMDKFEIPWVCVFGNHDEEGRADIAKICDILLESKYGMFEYGAEGLNGAGNYVLNLKRGQEVAYSLYMMYSGMKSPEKEGETFVEDNINAKQIEWYNWNVAGINAANGSSVKNMAFFHVPLKQYAELETYELGERGEPVCPQSTEYGFFDAFKVGGGTHTFVGHDHNNNFIGDYQGVKLGYIQKSSYNCYFKGGMTGGTLLTIKPDNTVTMAILNF